MLAREYDVAAERDLLAELHVLPILLAIPHGYAEVDQIDLVHLLTVQHVVANEHVVRLQVTMNDAARVQLLQDGDHLQAKRDEALQREVLILQPQDLFQARAETLLSDVRLALEEATLMHLRKARETLLAQVLHDLVLTIIRLNIAVHLDDDFFFCASISG